MGRGCSRRRLPWPTSTSCELVCRPRPPNVDHRCRASCRALDELSCGKGWLRRSTHAAVSSATFSCRSTTFFCLSQDGVLIMPRRLVVLVARHALCVLAWHHPSCCVQPDDAGARQSRVFGTAMVAVSTFCGVGELLCRPWMA